MFEGGKCVMKLTVLGNNGPYPGIKKACSGYLFEHSNIKILLDCGNGVLSKLQEYCRIEELTCIILSHLHYDHMSDIMVLKYAVEGKRKRGVEINSIKLYLPDEPVEEYQKIISKNIFESTPINEGLKLDISNLKISFKMVNHPIKCFATKIENDNKIFVYSGDTALTPELVEFTKDADLFLCDAGLLAKDKKEENVPHLTAYEVGIVAKEANVKRLLLTHFWPEDDVIQHLAEAKMNYPEAEIAIEGNEYNI